MARRERSVRILMPLLSEEMVMGGISPIYLPWDRVFSTCLRLWDSKRLWQERSYGGFTLRSWLLDEGVVVVAEDE
jgi:hypothetical protein